MAAEFHFTAASEHHALRLVLDILALEQGKFPWRITLAQSPPWNRRPLGRVGSPRSVGKRSPSHRRSRSDGIHPAPVHRVALSPLGSRSELEWQSPDPAF